METIAEGRSEIWRGFVETVPRYRVSHREQGLVWEVPAGKVRNKNSTRRTTFFRASFFKSRKFSHAPLRERISLFRELAKPAALDRQNFSRRVKCPAYFFYLRKFDSYPLIVRRTIASNVTSCYERKKV